MQNPRNPASSISIRTWSVFIVLVLLAAALRVPRLEQRPMHCDESVLADKSGTLLEQGRYEYDPDEFHGPTLHYLTLLPAWLQGAGKYTEMNETTLRSVPAAFGVLLVAAQVLLVPVLGAAAAIAAALLAAISPALVFYSRYYIHEMLFVFFSFGLLLSVCRYLRRRSAGWAISGGAFAGLAFATKETAILVFASLALALLFNRGFESRRGDAPASTRFDARHLLWAGLTATGIALLLFSSFLSHPRGVVDSVLAYRSYIHRAGSDSLHFHPWYYYLKILLYWHSKGGPVWTEGLIVVLAVLGFAAGLSKSRAGGMDARMLRIIGFYTLSLVVVYSAIPYKTPWCLLGFLHGMILLAGAGAVSLIRIGRSTKARILVMIPLVAASANLGWQAWAASFRFEADPRNPYVYAHTGTDVFLIVRRVEDLARSDPDGYAMPIQIISRENLWPLPWYLRRFTAIQWWNGVSDQARSAPLILITPDMEPALARKLYDLPPPGERELYMNIFDRAVELRPQVELRGYASKSLWDEYQQREAAAQGALR